MQTTKPTNASQQSNARNVRISQLETQRVDEEEQYTNSMNSSQKSRTQQSEGERRKLRKSYRNLITETENQKQELIQPHSDGLDRALDKSDLLFRQVRRPREAALDSEFLSLASSYGVEQTYRLHTGFKTMDINEFVTKLRNNLRGNRIANNETMDTEAQDLDNLQWDSLGEHCVKYFQRTPTVTFMFGPLNTEAVQKKERKKRQVEQVGKKISPDQVTADQTEEQLIEETKKKVEDLSEYLTKAKTMDFFHFVSNPESFSQTVENIFHFSFLIKDGHAALKEKDAQVIAEPQQPPRETDISSGRAERKQCVVRLDYKAWKQANERMQISRGYLPTRKKGHYPTHFSQKQSQQLSQANKSARASLLASKSPESNKNSNGVHNKDETSSEDEVPKKKKTVQKKKKTSSPSQEKVSKKKKNVEEERRGQDTSSEEEVPTKNKHVKKRRIVDSDEENMEPEESLQPKKRKG